MAAWLPAFVGWNVSKIIDFDDHFLATRTLTYKHISHTIYSRFWSKQYGRAATEHEMRILLM